MKRIADGIIRGVLVLLPIFIGGMIVIWLFYPIYERVYNSGNLFLMMFLSIFAFGLGGTLFTILILFICAVITGHTKSFINELKDIFFH